MPLAKNNYYSPNRGFIYRSELPSRYGGQSRQRMGARGRHWNHGERRMNKEPGWIFHTKEYRGCGITAASYRTRSGDWIPEACFWVHTESGWRRFWVASFAHCLGGEEVYYPSKIEADNRAFRMARALIDKTLPEFDKPSYISPPAPANYLAKVMGIARRPLSALSRLKELRGRQ